MQGLENIGAVCVINSLIQIICRNTYLRETILSYELSDDTFTSNLKEILVLMHEKEKSLIPRKFVKKYLIHLKEHLDMANSLISMNCGFIYQKQL